MNDPSCFTNLHEYYTFIYAISYMMLVWNNSDCNAGVLGKFLLQPLFQEPTIYANSWRNTSPSYFLLCGCGFNSNRHDIACFCGLEPAAFLYACCQNRQQPAVGYNRRLPIYQESRLCRNNVEYAWKCFLFPFCFFALHCVTNFGSLLWNSD